MTDFAVHHDGMPEDQGRWVLHVDATNERVLLCDEDKRFYWRPIADCVLQAAQTPSQPLLVMPVQPQPQAQNGLVVPEMNRAMRRNGNN